MHGDSLAAKSLEGQLVKLAKSTPFSLVEVQDATKQLMAYGFAAGDITKNIRMLGDVASGLKIPFSDIAYLYGTLKTQGVAHSKDIYQFTNRGINLVPELAKQFKIAEKDVMKFVESGKVGFKDIEKAFKSMTSEGGMFFGMMEEQSKTVGGQISNIGDAWTQVQVEIGKSQSGIIAGTLKFVNEFVSELQVAFTQSNKMDDAMKRFGGKGFGFFDWSGGEKRAYEAMDVFDDYVDRSGKSLQKALESKARLSMAIAAIAGQYHRGQISEQDYKNFVAIARSSKERVEGNISLFNKTEKLAPPDKLEKLAKDPDTARVKGTSHTTVNMTINKLIEKLVFLTNNMPESTAKIKEEVTKVLLEAAADAQVLMRG